MSKSKIPQREIPEEDKPEPEPVKEPAYELQVLTAVQARGFKLTEFDTVKAIHLFGKCYRVNFYKNNKIPLSYFVKFSLDEGIIRSYPNMPIKEEL